jgi:hypothetical protein
MKLKDYIGNSKLASHSKGTFQRNMLSEVVIVIKHRNVVHLILRGDKMFKFMVHYTRDYTLSYLGKARLTEKKLMESDFSTIVYKNKKLYNQWIGQLVLNKI